MSAAPQLTIAIPALARPWRVAPLVENVHAVDRVGCRLLFLCSPGDDEEIAAVEAAGAEHVVVDWPAAGGDYARKINFAFRSSSEEWFLCGADDIVFEPDWDVEATLAGQGDRFSVIGTNDTANPLVLRRRHTTHPLVRRSYIEECGGTFDGTGEVYCEQYDHQYVDNELVQMAIFRRVWAFAAHSVVRHLHPLWHTAEMDSTYVKALRASAADRKLYVSRMGQLRSRRNRNLRYNHAE